LVIVLTKSIYRMRKARYSTVGRNPCCITSAWKYEGLLSSCLYWSILFLLLGTHSLLLESPYTHHVFLAYIRLCITNFFSQLGQTTPSKAVISSDSSFQLLLQTI
jgi:hypothetical protein